MKWKLYRAIMKLAHHYSWHHTKTIHPDGDTVLICHWCGLSYLKKKADYPNHKYSEERQK